MKFSVVVCTFNQSENLRRVLKSLREAVIPDHLSCEFVLVDNNSDDDTRLVFEEIEKHYESKIRYVFEEKRGGEVKNGRPGESVIYFTTITGLFLLSDLFRS